MSRITVNVDLDELSKMISRCVRTCLDAHRIQFVVDGRLLLAEETTERLREVGNNVAALFAFQELEP